MVFQRQGGGEGELKENLSLTFKLFLSLHAPMFWLSLTFWWQFSLNCRSDPYPEPQYWLQSKMQFIFKLGGGPPPPSPKSWIRHCYNQHEFNIGLGRVNTFNFYFDLDERHSKMLNKFLIIYGQGWENKIEFDTPTNVGNDKHRNDKRRKI